MHAVFFLNVEAVRGAGLLGRSAGLATDGRIDAMHRALLQK